MHTQGKLSFKHEYGQHYSINNEGYWLGRIRGYDNAVRLIACWDVCANIPTERLLQYAELPRAHRDHIETQQPMSLQDELVAALDRAANALESRCAFGEADLITALLEKHNLVKHNDVSKI